MNCTRRWFFWPWRCWRQTEVDTQYLLNGTRGWSSCPASFLRSHLSLLKRSHTYLCRICFCLRGTIIFEIQTKTLYDKCHHSSALGMEVMTRHNKKCDGQHQATHTFNPIFATFYQIIFNDPTREKYLSSFIINNHYRCPQKNWGGFKSHDGSISSYR